MSLLPTGWVKITVNGVSCDVNGNANIGSYVFILSQNVFVDGTEVVQAPVIAQIDPAAGTFSAVLPANNDPAVAPQGTYYTVYEKFAGGRDPYLVAVDAQSTGGTVNLFSIAPLVTPQQLVDSRGPPGNTLFAVFDIDPSTGELSVTTPVGYLGPAFSINASGYLGVSV